MGAAQLEEGKGFTRIVSKSRTSIKIDLTCTTTDCLSQTVVVKGTNALASVASVGTAAITGGYRTNFSKRCRKVSVSLTTGSSKQVVLTLFFRIPLIFKTIQS